MLSVGEMTIAVTKEKAAAIATIPPILETFDWCSLRLMPMEQPLFDKACYDITTSRSVT
jgi:hypothetical protein